MATWIDVNSNYLLETGRELSSDLNAIRNSVENILSTPVGSRPMEREYGSRIHYFIHEPMDAITQENLRVSIMQSLERWEPRIRIDTRRTNVTLLPTTNGYALDLFFSIIVPSVDTSMRFVIKRIQ